MFHTLINIAYIIPNLYLFARIWKLFINKGYHLHYTLVYLFFALIYPATSFFSDSEANRLVSTIIDAGNYILTFYLYIFLSVLCYDIYLIINYFFKIVPPKKLKTTVFKKKALGSMILLSGFVVIGGIINFNTIRTSEYSIEIPRRSSSINHLKVAFVADFHLNENTNVHFVQRFVKEIETINPDLMLYGGDIVEGDRRDEDMTRFEELLKEIKPADGVFTVLGNHEFYAGQDKGTFLEKAGMTLLNDTAVIINNSFSLVGRMDQHFNSRKTITEVLANVADTLPIIMIDHRPTDIDNVSKTSTDIQLSGHTHDGQLFPINLVIRKMYILSWGYKKFGNTNFFVTSGIRLWGPPVRTAGKSEILVLDITFTDK
jgi:uncharacterized protein